MNLPWTTPKKVNAVLTNFTRKLSKAAPVWVTVEHTYPALKCFLNCNIFCAENPNATIEYGWIIWSVKVHGQKLLMAEFHSLVVENGKRRCITSQLDGEETILFVSDSVRKPEIEINGNVVLRGFANVESLGPAINYQRFPLTSEDSAIILSMIDKGTMKIPFQVKSEKAKN
jgi:hypothetical protein